MSGKNNKYYEITLVLLLALALGMSVLCRLEVVFLFPLIKESFKLTYTDLGAFTLIIAIAVALSSWFAGALTDQFGKKIILLPSIIVFSLLSWLSGITQNFFQMFITRGFLGLGVGALMPPSVAAIWMESKPERRGFNFGLHQAAIPLVAIAFGSIITTQLASVMSWRAVLGVLGIPGVILCIILYFYMREPQIKKTSENTSPKPEPGKIKDEISIRKIPFFMPLKYKNVLISSIVAPCEFSSFFIITAFGISYLTEILHLPMKEAGFLMSFLGIGGFLGSIILPHLSDYVGRKPVIVTSLFLMAAIIFIIYGSGPNFLKLSVLFILGGFFPGGIAPIAVSALTTEDCPPEFAGASSAIPIAFGEIVGGALMPYIAGCFSDIYDLKTAILIAGILPVLGGLASFFYKETAPKITLGK